MFWIYPTPSSIYLPLFLRVLDPSYVLVFVPLEVVISMGSNARRGVCNIGTCPNSFIVRDFRGDYYTFHPFYQRLVIWL